MAGRGRKGWGHTGERGPFRMLVTPYVLFVASSLLKVCVSMHHLTGVERIPIETQPSLVTLLLKVHGVCLEKFCPPVPQEWMVFLHYLQLLCVCLVGEGKEREIPQAPGFLRQPAITRPLLSMVQRAGKQANGAGGVFPRPSASIQEEGWVRGFQGEEVVRVCLGFRSMSACMYIIIYCFVFWVFLVPFCLSFWLLSGTHTTLSI